MCREPWLVLLNILVSVDRACFGLWEIGIRILFYSFFGFSTSVMTFMLFQLLPTLPPYCAVTSVFLPLPIKFPISAAPCIPANITCPIVCCVSVFFACEDPLPAVQTPLLISCRMGLYFSSAPILTFEQFGPEMYLNFQYYLFGL